MEKIKNLIAIEIELKKRLKFPYKWGRKQSDSWDTKTRFIYQTLHFEDLLKRTKNLDEGLKNYALNRWYNFWSAKAIEAIFTTHKSVEANEDIYHKSVDFKIEQIAFDHKTSVFPKKFHQRYYQAVTEKEALIRWLYQNQSQESRKHLKNRLFIIVYDKKLGQHWRMKSEIQLLKVLIDDYIKNFCSDRLLKFDFGNEKILSDIIPFSN